MASKVLNVKYPLDKTGTSITNKVVGEIREINSTRERAFVPAAGPFYADSMVITNNATGKVLVPVDDYILCQPFQQAALRTGKDVECVIWLKTDVPIEVKIDYQVVGGEYSFNIDALLQMIQEIDLDGRPVTWGSIIGRPTAYPAAPHIHDIGDTYGWEYVVFQLEGIRNAILVGDEASHDELRQQMQAMRADLEAEIAAVDKKITNHIADLNNPHQTTKAQVGLSDVANYPPATTAEANAGTVNNRYMTPATTNVLISRLVKEAMDAHIADKNNPHGVTKAQVGLGNVPNYSAANSAEATSGVVNDRFMTPGVTKEAIAQQVGNAFNSHVANVSNPHQVTKNQVGLGLVDNFATASSAEAKEGLVNNKFMTPQTTKDAIAKQAGDLLNAHVTNVSNPHQVTKDQVGLGNLPNAVTKLRNINSDVTLLLASGMSDHIQSGDHDARYVQLNNPVSCAFREVSGTLQAFIGGAWRQVWPAQWQ